MGTFEFPLPSCIGSCKRLGYQSVNSCITRGIGNQKWQSVLLHQWMAVGIYYTHVQDGGQGKRDKESIFILSIVIEVNLFR